MASSALAADLPVKAPVIVEAPWWTHGFIEFGGRGFLNDPPYGGHIWQGQGSLAKFYEYKTEKPGPFGNFNFATGSGNGLYQFEAWGYNPGYSDQRYDAYFTKAGEHYLDFQWDQTPHVYSTSASTLFNTSGNALTLINPNFGTQLHTALGGANWQLGAIPSAAAVNTIGNFINSNVAPTDIAIRRETAAVDYRWTPTDNWDVKADYSHMRRTGSQVDSVLFSTSTTGSRVDVPKPIDDTTQNFGVNGEYIGTSPWGQRFNAMVGYAGSVYTDGFSNYTVQNPFCFGATPICASNPANTNVLTGPLAMMSTPPSNNVNGVNGTWGFDLPLNSRYMGTVAYSEMRQNDQFNPFSINAFASNGAAGGIPVVLTGHGTSGSGTSLAALPAQSLNGQINTLLVNNVLTTQINPNLKTKLSYRYYNYDNQTPQLTFNDWILTDARSANTTNETYAPVNPLMTGYIKQNGAAEVTWRPVTTVNIGSSYNYERYDFTKFDASSTNENTGKVYADWKPERWLTFRGSANYGERRASNYDYLGNAGNFMWPTPPFPNGTEYTPYYRQFFLDDRNRAQAKFQVDIAVLRNFIVTPTVKWSDDEYLLKTNEVGMVHDRGTAAGLEAAYAFSPDLRFLFSYMNEQRSQFTYSTGTKLFPFGTSTAYTCGTTPTPGSCNLYSADINDRVNTFIFGANYAVIPSRFELGLNYTYVYAKNSSPLLFQNGTGPSVSNNLPGSPFNTLPFTSQFPDVKTNYQRIDANARYVIDPDLTRGYGIPGQIALKLRYAWERNSVSNWNNDLMLPYMYPVLQQNNALFYQSMAWNNPNYNAHLLAGTVSWAW